MVAQTEATDHPNGHDIPTPPNQRDGTIASCPARTDGGTMVSSETARW